MKKRIAVTALIFSLAVNLTGEFFHVNKISGLAEEKNTEIEVLELRPFKDDYAIPSILGNQLNNKNFTDSDDLAILKRNNYYCLGTYDQLMNILLVYKDSQTGASFILKGENNVLPIIGDRNGMGVTSLATADLDSDGSIELYFTYSWDSDGYCSQAGYYDTGSDKITYFDDYILPDSEMVFAVENDVLTLKKADIVNYENKAVMEFATGDTVAEINFKDNKIGLSASSDSIIKLESGISPDRIDIPEWFPKNYQEAWEIREKSGVVSIIDDHVCVTYMVGSPDSFRGQWIEATDDSDIKTPLTYRVYYDKADALHSVCYIMEPNTYLEFTDSYTSVYSFVSDENGLISRIKPGDIDSGGTVDLTDLTELSLFILKDTDFTEAQKKSADVTGDGEVDLTDLALLKQYVMNDNVKLGKSVKGKW